MAEKFIELHHVNKHYGGVHALKDIDFDLNVGEVHCLVGKRMRKIHDDKNNFGRNKARRGKRNYSLRKEDEERFSTDFHGLRSKGNLSGPQSFSKPHRCGKHCLQPAHG